MEKQFLAHLIIVLGLSVIVILAFLKVRIPAVLGFILTGVLAGPHALGIIEGRSEVEALSELGVVLLLFSIGIEFSLKDLLESRRTVLVGGSIQVVLTATVVFLVCTLLGLDQPQSLFLGVLVAMSSTAIVLKMLDERSEITTPHGKNTLSILIFQDLLVVALMPMLPIVGAGSAGVGGSIPVLVGKAAALMLFLYASYRWIVPMLLYQIARTKSRDLFMLSIILICLGIAWLTSLLGLSLALGAFLAGLIISESEYSQEALGRILPLRDIFMSLFFISVGMLLDLGFIVHHLGAVIGLTLLIIFLKVFTGSFSTLVLGYPFRATVLAGLALAQIGEFSFILSKTGLGMGLITTGSYQVLLAISLFTMAATPFIINASPALADMAVRLPLPHRVLSGLRPLGIRPLSEAPARMTDHLVVIGYGLNGRNVSRAASMTGIPYIVIEMNPDTVRSERRKGTPIFYGDATQEAILHHVGIHRAHVVVITIPDAPSARRVTELVRKLSPATHIIARTRYLKEVEPLYALGADQVIPEEYETSIEIFARALAEYLVPRDDIERCINELRSSGYGMFRSLSGEATTIADLQHNLPDFKVHTLTVHPGSPLAGQTLIETQIRKRYQVSILAIRRGDRTVINPGGDDVLLPGDTIIVSGDLESVLSIIPVLRGIPERSAD
jgi:CPA2 family monovalent cation:H+ antiporter-2